MMSRAKFLGAAACVALLAASAVAQGFNASSFSNSSAFIVAIPLFFILLLCLHLSLVFTSSSEKENESRLFDVLFRLFEVFLAL
jgi:hypothetical protein